MATLYTTVDELRSQINKETTTSDTVLEQIIEAASRAIDSFCWKDTKHEGFFVAQTIATARLYSGSGTPAQRIDHCIEVTKVEVKDSPTDSTYTEWASTDYICASGDQRAPDFNRLPYTLLIVDPTGDETYFRGGQYSYRRGFRPLDSLEGRTGLSRGLGARGVPTVRVTAKWGWAATVPPQIKQACIIQSAQWFKRGEGAWARTVGSADVGILAYPRGLDPAIQTILVDAGFRHVSIG